MCRRLFIFCIILIQLIEFLQPFIFIAFLQKIPCWRGTTVTFATILNGPAALSENDESTIINAQKTDSPINIYLFVRVV